jgi:hypothetical protein
MVKVKTVEKKEVEPAITVAFDEKPMADISLMEFEKAIQEYAEAKEEVERLAGLKNKATEVMDMFESKVMSIMQAFNKTSYRSSYGLLVRSERWSWKTPKSDEEKDAFYGYLRAKGLFDTMISVNSQTLNSFAKKELEAAKETGDIDFKIPGLGEPTLTEMIALRR